jgi:hypothetical protein
MPRSSGGAGPGASKSWRGKGGEGVPPGHAHVIPARHCIEEEIFNLAPICSSDACVSGALSAGAALSAPLQMESLGFPS